MWSEEAIRITFLILTLEVVLAALCIFNSDMKYKTRTGCYTRISHILSECALLKEDSESAL